MKIKVIFIILFLSTFYYSHAQFNTIKKEYKKNYIIIEREKNSEEIDELKDTLTSNKESSVKEEEIVNTIVKKDAFRLVRNKPKRDSNNSRNNIRSLTNRLEGLSIKDLYKEIIDNDIHHPKIVLAQAILETGWFKSSVCRNKGNLFGLTNPRTGQYYEFRHWKESVKAYKTKVQYKYKGGNYLLWLRDIGYAEDPRYISSLVKILEQHFL